MNSLQVLHHHQVHNFIVYICFFCTIAKQPKCKNHCRAHSYTPFPLTSASFPKKYHVFFVSSHFSPKNGNKLALSTFDRLRAHTLNKSIINVCPSSAATMLSVFVHDLEYTEIGCKHGMAITTNREK